MESIAISAAAELTMSSISRSKLSSSSPGSTAMPSSSPSESKRRASPGAPAPLPLPPALAPPWSDPFGEPFPCRTEPGRAGDAAAYGLGFPAAAPWRLLPLTGRSFFAEPLPLPLPARRAPASTTTLGLPDSGRLLLGSGIAGDGTRLLSLAA